MYSVVTKGHWLLLTYCSILWDFTTFKIYFHCQACCISKALRSVCTCTETPSLHALSTIPKVTFNISHHPLTTPYALTIHYIWNTCTHAHSCCYLICQSCGNYADTGLGQDLQVMLTSNLRMEKNVVSVNLAGLSISETAHVLALLNFTQNGVKYRNHTVSEGSAG